jgi:mevalonate kinase
MIFNIILEVNFYAQFIYFLNQMQFKCKIQNLSAKVIIRAKPVVWALHLNLKNKAGLGSSDAFSVQNVKV